MTQPVARRPAPRRPFDTGLLVLALLTSVVAGALAWLHWTYGPPAQPVNIRWQAEASASERAQVERDAGLADGRQMDGPTWQYHLRNRSRDNIERLLTHPLVEDTHRIDREALRVQVVRPELPTRVRAWLELDWSGYLSLALALAAALMAVRARQALTAVVRAVTAAVRSTTRRLQRSLVEGVHALETPPAMGPLTALGMIVLAIAWAAGAIPYVVAGSPDFEEYFTGVATTRISMDAILHGAWPFWSLDLGLGAPQPLRFHFITHPLAPLCLATDCHALLRSIASLHVLVGAVFMAMLAQRFTGNRLLALAAALTWCMSSSVIHPVFKDDWPFTAIHESAVPVMVYAALAIGDEANSRHSLLWSLVLGGISGLVLSMTFPIFTLMMVATVALVAPGLRRRLPWLALAGVVTLLIGAAQLQHIFEEYARTPPHVGRTDHGDFLISQHLWSAFVRPIPVPGLRDMEGLPNLWRTVFLGPPFAVAAVVAATTSWDAAIRPLRVGLLLGVLGFIVPPGWLFNVNTAQYLYRTYVNVFGIVLAVYCVQRFTSTPGGARWRRAVVAVQVCWAAVVIGPIWYPVFGAAAGIRPPSDNTLISPGIAEDIAARAHAAPGRVIFGREANDALRKPWFNMVGLAPNQLPILGVPAVTAVLYGLTTDALSPQSGTLEGQVVATPGTIKSRALLNALGVRYVLAFGDDAVAPGLPEVRRWSNGLRMHENSEAWPEAFFVDALSNDPIPRLPGCGHNRFLCADFSQFAAHRLADPMDITRLRDGIRLTFPPSDAPRSLLITQWYYPEWAVTDGRASVRRSAEQLIGVEVAPGERTVTVQYRPRLRAALLAVALSTETVVLIAIAVLVAARWRSAQAMPSVA